MTQPTPSDRPTTPTQRARLASLLGDGLAVAAIVCGWLLLLWRAARGRPFVFYDTYRDLAYAHNILAGRVWSDPIVAGESAWYPPGGPWLAASLARLAGASVLDVYARSPWWLNVLIPLALFLLVRRALDRCTAFLAVAFVLLGSPWWLSHAPAPMASVQGVVCALVALLAWQTFAVNRLAAAACGLLLGLSAWVHPLAAFFVTCGIAGQAMLAARAGSPPRAPPTTQPPPANSGGPVLRVGIGAAAALLVALPLAPLLAAQPLRNPAPLAYFASELSDPAFALQARTPAVPLLGLVGVFLAARSPRLAWLPGYLLAAALGQAAGYAAHWWRWPVPFLLPHQCQWHTQLALGVGAAVAITALGRTLALWLVHRRGASRPPAWSWLVSASLALLALSPALIEVDRIQRYAMQPGPLRRGERELVEFVARETPIDATIICPARQGYLLIAGRTGRKLVAVPDGHMSPRVDAAARLRDLERLLATESEAEFRELAARYDARWLAVIAHAADEATPLRRRYERRPGVRLIWADREGEVLLYRVELE